MLKKNSWKGANLAVQHVRLPCVTSTPYWRNDSSPGSDRFLLTRLEKQRRTWVLEPCHSRGRPGRNFWLLALAWPTRHWRWQLGDSKTKLKIFLSLFFLCYSASQINIVYIGNKVFLKSMQFLGNVDFPRNFWRPLVFIFLQANNYYPLSPFPWPFHRTLLLNWKANLKYHLQLS